MMIVTRRKAAIVKALRLILRFAVGVRNVYRFYRGCGPPALSQF